MQDLTPPAPPINTSSSLFLCILNPQAFLLPGGEQSSCVLPICCFYRHLSSLSLEDNILHTTTAFYMWTLILAKSRVSMGFQSSQFSKCYNPFNYHTVGTITAPRINERMPFSFNLWHDVWPKQNDLSPMSYHNLLKTAPFSVKGWNLCMKFDKGIYIPAILWCLLSSLLLSLCHHLLLQPKVKPLRQK